MLFLQKFSYLFILVIISIICSCNLIGKYENKGSWEDIRVNLEHFDKDLDELRRDLLKAKGDIETLNETIKDLEKQKGSLETQNEQNKNTINTLNDDIKELKAKKAELESKVTQLEKDLQSLRKQKETAERGLEQKDSKINELNQTIESLRREKSALEREKTTLEGSNSKKDAQITKLNEEIAAKLSEISAKEAEKQALKSEKDAIIAGLNQDLNKIKKEKDALNNKLSELEGTRDNLNRELQDLRDVIINSLAQKLFDEDVRYMIFNRISNEIYSAFGGIHRELKTVSFTDKFFESKELAQEKLKVLALSRNGNEIEKLKNIIRDKSIYENINLKGKAKELLVEHYIKTLIERINRGTVRTREALDEYGSAYYEVKTFLEDIKGL